MQMDDPPLRPAKHRSSSPGQYNHTTKITTINGSCDSNRHARNDGLFFFFLIYWSANNRNCTKSKKSSERRERRAGKKKKKEWCGITNANTGYWIRCSVITLQSYCWMQKDSNGWLKMSRTGQILRVRSMAAFAVTDGGVDVVAGIAHEPTWGWGWHYCCGTLLLPS